MLIGAGLLLGLARPAAGVPLKEGKPIDVVLCLDVSGSMGGLIDSAKTRLWDIVNELAKVKPTPQLRVSLYSYGHSTYPANNGWVRKEVDLSTDLDEIYRKLNALTINGGEEYVARVSHAALVEQKWSEDPGALKIVFVCGNEPATQDPSIKVDIVAELAKKKGIVVNTIYCSWGHPEEIKGWQDFALQCKGKFAIIEHNKQVVQVQTPFDKGMVELNEKLNKTYIAYGRMGYEKAANQLAQDANAAKAGAQANASRIATKGGELYKNGEWCVVSRLLENPKFDITKIPEADLPEDLKKLKPDERVALVKKKAEERAKINKEISELSTKRQKYLETEMKKHASDADKALDGALKKILREQAKEKGIEIPE
jgi:hypothetical protein